MLFPRMFIFFRIKEREGLASKQASQSAIALC